VQTLLQFETVNKEESMRRPLLRRTARALSVLVAVFALAVAGTVYAQTDVTTTRITGTVTAAADGSPLPGATVETKNEETGLVVVAVTDADGFYRALNLPTGSYTITATLDGFHPAEDYHQRYYQQNQSQPYCRATITPKMAKLRAKYAARLKPSAATRPI